MRGPTRSSRLGRRKERVGSERPRERNYIRRGCADRTGSERSPGARAGRARYRAWLANYDSGDGVGAGHANPARQARLSRLIRQAGTDVIALNALDATAVGLLLAQTATADIVDAHVVLCAQRAAQVVATSDPGDLRRIAPDLRIVQV